MRGPGEIASILHGRIHLEVDSDVLLAEWRALFATLPRREIPEELIPFSRLFALTRSGFQDPGWSLACDAGWRLEIPTSCVATVLALLEQAACGEVLREGGGMLPVHAALVAPSREGVVAILGPGFSGKSTLGTALWESGWAFFSDDRCFFRINSREIPSVVPVPRRVSLRMPSLDLLRAETREAVLGAHLSQVRGGGAGDGVTRCLFRPSDLRPEPGRQDFLLRAVVLLSSGEGASEGCVELAPVEVIKDVLACTSLHPGQNVTDMVTPWMSILEEVPVFRLGRATLPGMRSSLEGLVARLKTKGAGGRV